MWGIWYKYCVHIYINGKMIPDETITGMGVGRIKENVGGGKFKYVYLLYFKNFCKRTMYPHPAQ
jgi:hypothetical protein